jgi:sphingomyelin phosphodiesterase acid-like 3
MTFLRPRLLAVLSVLIFCGLAQAQVSQRAHETSKVLLISDIHFDPFHDPAKVSQLIVAPVSGWAAILSSPDSPAQAKDFAALKATCKQTANDTSYALLVSALDAIQKNAPDARFVTMSGDMLAHDLPCKFAAIEPAGTPAQYELLVEKTIEFEARMIESALPHAALYLAMGNNDSNCDDYKLDTNTAFLATLGKVVGRGAGRAWTHAAAAEFATGGYYSVTMAAPMQRTRLIVVNDIFLAPKYTSCANKADASPGAAQMRWLAAQLDDAKRLHQQVWVMGHIPPGVNPYGTTKKSPLKICAPAGTPDAGPSMFMPSEILGDTLTEHADVIRLAIFAHSHADELRLFGSGENSVALKFVPSITPFNGNRPAFTVAQVDPATAVMEDYTVFAAADAAGSTWGKEYSFSEAYGHGGFTPATLRALTDGFLADPAQKTPESQAYLRYYQAGKPLAGLPPLFWHAGACALNHSHAADYAACACTFK